MSPRNRDDESDDTDWDSIYDEAPANGSYQPRPSSPSSVKAREAAHHDGQVNDGPRESTSQSQQRSQQTARWVDESTPLLDAGPPPPAYSDVTANRPYAGDAVLQSPHYQGPQSMGGRPAMDMNEEGHADFDEPVKKRGRRWGSPWVRRLLQHTILVLVVVSIIVLTMTITQRDTKGGKDDHKGDKGDQETPHDDIPDVNPFPQIPSDGWSPPRLKDCRFEYYNLNHVYEFPNAQSFSLTELMEEKHLLDPDIDGMVTITAGGTYQKSAIVVAISAATTEQFQITSLNVKQTEESLSIKAPSLSSTGIGSGQHCLAVFVTIYIRDDVNLADLEIATEHLSLKVKDTLRDRPNTFDVSNSTEFTIIQGGMNAAYWTSRHTIIDVISGSVTGTYALRDLLLIKTRSGSINVDVDPKSADETSPAPAVFTAKSVSGSVTARFPTHGSSDDIPERDYRTHAETNSGGIAGSYILGLSSTFRTTSGSISATVLPYAAENVDSTLRTETGSGHTDVTLLSPFQHHGRPMTRLRSSHKSASSSLTLVYPQEWEGTIDGGTTSGSLSVRGKDVHVLKVDEGPVGKKIRARKGSGEGGSKFDFWTHSGSVDVTVGDLH